MKNTFIAVIISLLISVLLLIGYDRYFSKESKVAFIRIGKVLQEYKGMSDANEQFEYETKIVQANIDTLKSRYERLLLKEKELGAGDKTLSYQIGISRSEYENYSNRAYEEMQVRKNELNQQVITKVNDFVENYGKTNEFKMIFGATTAGSIMYGEDADDLTEEIIEKLNQDFDSNIQ